MFLLVFSDTYVILLIHIRIFLVTSKPIIFLENHEDIMLSIFPDDLTEEDEIYNLHALCALEELNPNDTIEAADYDAEIYNWTSWISRQVFYV